MPVLRMALSSIATCAAALLGLSVYSPLVREAPGERPSPAGVEVVARAAQPITGTPSDYDALVGAIGDARFVLLGEATHGTSEFYRERARITQRLVQTRGFGAVIIEGDWPDADRINRYVRGLGDDATPDAALGDFEDFPRWMWRNAEFRDLIAALRSHNERLPQDQRVGVYGMDVYNLYGAADAVVAYLGKVDPPAAARARASYRCFARYRPDPQLYGIASRRASRSCAEEAAAVLAELRKRPRPDEPVAAEARFSALRSAASVAGAEEYYRAAFAGSLSWNVRDQRMASTVVEVADHLAAVSGRPGRVVVWAHNSHVGDARATDAPLRGELNLGQLMRQRAGGAAYLVGFTTHSGTVIAADAWGEPGRTHELRPALPESYAALFHAAGIGNSLLLLRRGTAVAELLAAPRLERAVGVIYARRTERQSHYFHARLADQFDAVIHIDRSRAVAPLR